MAGLPGKMNTGFPWRQFTGDNPVLFLGIQEIDLF
jgi:hypothetical protein